MCGVGKFELQSAANRGGGGGLGFVACHDVSVSAYDIVCFTPFHPLSCSALVCAAASFKPHSIYPQNGSFCRAGRCVFKNVPSSKQCAIARMQAPA